MLITSAFCWENPLKKARPTQNLSASGYVADDYTLVKTKLN